MIIIHDEKGQIFQSVTETLSDVGRRKKRFFTHEGNSIISVREVIKLSISRIDRFAGRHVNEEFVVFLFIKFIFSDEFYSCNSY